MQELWLILSFSWTSIRRDRALSWRRVPSQQTKGRVSLSIQVQGKPTPVTLCLSLKLWPLNSPHIIDTTGGVHGHKQNVVWAGHLSSWLNYVILERIPSVQNAYWNAIKFRLPFVTLRCCLVLNSLVRGAVPDDVNAIGFSLFNDTSLSFEILGSLITTSYPKTLA